MADLSLYRLFKQCYISLSVGVTLRPEVMNALVVRSKGVRCYGALWPDICEVSGLCELRVNERMDSRSGDVLSQWV